MILTFRIICFFVYDWSVLRVATTWNVNVAICNSYGRPKPFQQQIRCSIFHRLAQLPRAYVVSELHALLYVVVCCGTQSGNGSLLTPILQRASPPHDKERTTYMRRSHSQNSHRRRCTSFGQCNTRTDGAHRLMVIICYTIYCTITTYASICVTNVHTHMRLPLQTSPRLTHLGTWSPNKCQCSTTSPNAHTRCFCIFPSATETCDGRVINQTTRPDRRQQKTKATGSTRTAAAAASTSHISTCVPASSPECAREHLIPFRSRLGGG